MKTRIGEPAKYIYFTPERMVDGRNWRYAIFTTAKGEQLRRFQFWADKGWRMNPCFQAMLKMGCLRKWKPCFTTTCRQF